MRGFLQISQNELPKTSVSRDASDNFHRKSFQKDRFVRGFLQISQKKLPKRAFRAMLPPKFTEQASKTSVWRDASDNSHRKSFQNERFAQCLLQNSQNKLPKRAFRAMLPTILTEKASKMIISCEASSKFHRTVLPKRAFRAMLPAIFTEKASKIIVSCEASSKICVSLQFRAIDTTFLARGFIRQKQNVPHTTAPCIPKFQNVRFATAACAKMYESIDREPTRFAHTKM